RQRAPDQRERYPRVLRLSSQLYRRAVGVHARGSLTERSKSWQKAEADDARRCRPAESLGGRRAEGEELTDHDRAVGIHASGRASVTETLEETLGARSCGRGSGESDDRNKDKKQAFFP